MLNHSKALRRALPAALVTLLAGAAPALADSNAAVYTETNAPSGNAIQAFSRSNQGTLTPAGNFATGGTGSNSPGGRQGAVALSSDRHTLYAVNSGSDSVSAFRVGHGAPTLEGVFPSGGVAPVSVAERDHRVYVLNSGDTPSRATPNVTELRYDKGRLTPVTGGTQELRGASGVAQVSVAPDGKRLLVTERVSNRLASLALGQEGRPSAPAFTPSNGATPFGFAFDPKGDAIVSEAGASTVSSYRFIQWAGLANVTASLPVGFGAACWVAVSPNGAYAYTGNASGSISGFAIDHDARLTPIGTTFMPAPDTPRDLAFSRDGRFLYAIATAGDVTGYRVNGNGSLTPITVAPAAVGITGVAAD